MLTIRHGLVAITLLALTCGLASAATWLAAARNWPTATETTDVPEGADLRFTHLLRDTLAPSWLPADQAPIPYVKGWGYLYTAENADYRLRVREKMEPVYEGAQEMRDGLIIAAEPTAGKMPMPKTKGEMLALLRDILLAQRIDWPTDPRYQQPVFTSDAKGATYTQPDNLTAWTDGTALYIAIYTEPAYRAPQDIWDTLPIKSAGAFSYPLTTAMRDPWLILAAQGWTPATAKALKAPEGAREHFELWTRGAVLADWLPSDYTKLLYLRDQGFISVKANNEFRVRTREVAIDTPLPAKAIVLAVEPLKGHLPLPQDVPAMSAMLDKFLTPALLTMPTLEQCPAEMHPHAGGVHFSQYRSEGITGDIPADVTAWTDGKILLIAIQEDFPRDCPTCGF